MTMDQVSRASDTRTVIRLTGVGKRYRLFESPWDRIRAALSSVRPVHHREFWSLRDVDLTIDAGTTLGVMGRNGSGKSTLLRIVCGVAQPTTGRVEVSGRLGALLELGAGFNPEFTGRQNALLQGQIQGMSRAEIERRLPEIEAFAGIGAFFEQPVKTYSSGMFVRLAFASAITMDPDILVIDEALAVGDAKFQRKCYQKFTDFQAAGKTIILVSHDTDAIVRHCDAAVLIDAGRVVAQGPPKEVASAYHALLFGTPGSASADAENPIGLRQSEVAADRAVADFIAAGKDAGQDQCKGRMSYNPGERRFGEGGARIVDYLMVAQDRADPTEVRSGSTLDIYVKIIFSRAVLKPDFGLAVCTVDGVTVYGNGTFLAGLDASPAGAGETRVVRFGLRASLRSGDYFIGLGCAEVIDGAHRLLDSRLDLIHLVVRAPRWFDGVADLEMSFSVVDADGRDPGQGRFLSSIEP